MGVRVCGCVRVTCFDFEDCVLVQGIRGQCSGGHHVSLNGRPQGRDPSWKHVVEVGVTPQALPRLVPVADDGGGAGLQDNFSCAVPPDAKMAVVHALRQRNARALSQKPAHSSDGVHDLRVDWLVAVGEGRAHAARHLVR